MKPADPGPVLFRATAPAPPIGAKMAFAAAPQRDNRPELRALTSLRFFAAMSVVLCHRRVFADGYPAVIFFFVLSGFVLTYSYVLAADGGLRATAGRFWFSRLARIAPAYYFSVMLVAPFLLYNLFVKSTIAPDQLWLSAGAMLTFLPGLLLPSAVAWNPPLWSLGVEVCLYAAFPWLVAACFRWSLAATFAVVLGALNALTALRIGLVWLVPDLKVTLYAFPLFYLPHFALGLTAARLFLFGPKMNRHGRATMIVGSLIAFAVAIESDWLDWLYLDPVLVPAATAMIVLMASSKMLGQSVLIVLGEASYAVYVVHSPLSLWWGEVERTKILSVWLSDLLYVALVIATAVIASYLIERPARAYLLKLARRVPRCGTHAAQI